jgi:hypothetical protein
LRYFTFGTTHDHKPVISISEIDHNFVSVVVLYFTMFSRILKRRRSHTLHLEGREPPLWSLPLHSNSLFSSTISSNLTW